MVAGEDKENTFINAAILLNTKDDMQKLFGKNDPIYNMKNADGGRLNEAADKMEQQIRKVYKTMSLNNEIKKDNYDAILAAAGIDDFNKLREAIETVSKNLGEVKKELTNAGIIKETNKELENEDLEMDDDGMDF